MDPGRPPHLRRARRQRRPHRVRGDRVPAARCAGSSATRRTVRRPSSTRTARSCSSLGLERLPTFVHLRQDTTVGAATEGWDPAEWQEVARQVARSMAWSVPEVAPPGRAHSRPDGRLAGLNPRSEAFRHFLVSGPVTGGNSGDRNGISRPRLRRVTGTARRTRLLRRAVVLKSRAWSERVFQHCVQLFSKDRRRHLRAKGSPQMSFRAKVSGVVLVALLTAGVLPAAVARGLPRHRQAGAGAPARGADPGQR